MNIAQRIHDLGIVLPRPPSPIANFVTAKIHGDLLFLSGQGPLNADGKLYVGKVGVDVSLDEAYQHARLTGLNLLSVAQDTLGSLDRVAAVIKVLGLVNADSQFIDHPKVINGCSDLFVSVFGEAVGRGARSSLGMGSLPGNQTVEIEAIFAIKSLD